MCHEFAQKQANASRKNLRVFPYLCAMILPIVGFGSPVLREVAKDITPEYPNLQQLIANMFATMYHASGVGLAAPQINLPIRLFVIDCTPMKDTLPNDTSTEEQPKMVFINARKIEETGTEWGFEEGCLSIPEVREEVFRQPHVRLRYMDEHFVEHETVFTGMKARVIQHEYDHIEGILFTDKINMLRKQLLRSRLTKISEGRIHTDYPMKFPRKKR